MVFVSSSTFGDSLPESLRVNFESDTSWLWRRVSGGAGAVFFRTDDDGDGGSGVFPAASVSNTDSRSESWLARLGAGGRGLLRSVCERLGSVIERGLELKNCGEVIDPGVEGDCTTGGAGGSSLSSTLMSLPCFELGGGGFFLPSVDDWNSAVKPKPRLSSSGSDISCDVRGDSGCASCTGSKIDCLDSDEVSVLLPPSPNACVICA